MTDADSTPTRSISITATQSPNAAIYNITPSISINGIAQPAQWGTGRWEVARDEPVTIVMGAHRGGMQYGMVQYVLQPGAPSDLEYKAPAIMDRPGQIGPRGSVTHSGNNILVPVYIIGGAAILVTMIIGGVIILFAFI